MNILIAEDSAPLRRLIRSMIATMSDEIFECVDGFQAVAVYAERQPDWVLMDIKMPVLDGIAASRAIRLINPQARIIIVTSYDDPDLRAEAKEAGATHYLVKDDMSRLCRLIAESAFE